MTSIRLSRCTSIAVAVSSRRPHSGPRVLPHATSVQPKPNSETCLSRALAPHSYAATVCCKRACSPAHAGGKHGTNRARTRWQASQLGTQTQTITSQPTGCPRARNPIRKMGQHLDQHRQHRRPIRRQTRRRHGSARTAPAPRDPKKQHTQQPKTHLKPFRGTTPTIRDNL